MLGGFDWGARTVDVIAALWPERCTAIVAVSGYTTTDLETTGKPLAPAAEPGRWYQFYLATERGQNRHDFNELIWRTASPRWTSDDATHDRSAASFDNPDHVDVAIHDYRWRQGPAPGEPRYDAHEREAGHRSGDLRARHHDRRRLRRGRRGREGLRAEFTGKYDHRIFAGIGHNVPQEEPKPFARAIVDANRP